MDYDLNHCAISPKGPELNAICHTFTICIEQDPGVKVRKFEMMGKIFGRTLNEFFKEVPLSAYLGISLGLGMLLILCSKLDSKLERNHRKA